MTLDLYLFYFFSSVALISTYMVITLPNAVHSVLFLIIVFCNVSGLLLILGAEFFSFIFLIVYVGAIAVLFLFVIMMLNVKLNPIKINIFSIFPIGFLIFFTFIFLTIFFVDNEFSWIANYFSSYTFWVLENVSLSNIEIIGLVLYTKFSLLFLLCGLILLVAMVGAIVLTMHQKVLVKKQLINVQLSRKPYGVTKFVKVRK